MKSSENGVAPAQSVTYEFGGFVLDRRELRRRDRSPVPLTPRLLDTLRYLVEHSEELLDKEEIMEAVWPDSIVEENNLAQAISKLRQVLGEQPGVEFIATVPRRGYRFVAPVRSIEAMEPVCPRAEESASLEPPITQRGRRITALWIGAAVVLLAGAALIWWEYSHSIPSAPFGDASASGKSIAVLPFDNLGSDKADAFFADGIQDDILTSLGKIKDLKVIARASTLDYRGTPSAVKLREIARALGASHVLEGSVRRANDRVVLDVALIDARNQRQVWAERYDRTLTDTLSLQGELAVEISRALQASLTPLENKVMAVKPTQNPDAYLDYLRGREEETGATRYLSYPKAVEFYQHAIELDPGFALARSRLSICASYLFWESSEDQWKTKARMEAEAALRLQPQLGEARLALTLCYLFGDHNYQRAIVELDRVAELLPNSAEVPTVAAIIHKLNQNYPARLAALERAVDLDPRSHNILMMVYRTHHWMRNWKESVRTLDRASVILPNVSELPWLRAQDQFQATNDLSVLEQFLASKKALESPAPPAWLKLANYSTAMLRRDYGKAAESLSVCSQQDLDDYGFGFHFGLKSFHEALLMVARDGDTALTRQALAKAQAEDETSLAAAIKDATRKDIDLLSPGRGHIQTVTQFRITLALLQAFLGQKEAAAATANEAINLHPAPAGSIEQHQLKAALALIYARTGEHEKAIDLIENLLKLPAEFPEGALQNITLADLKYGWQWDPLRNKPRFQKLLSWPEPTPAL